MDTLALVAWFRENKRSLPWRQNPTPYRVWISEVMLQQTQVSVVIGYFERWMARFPTIQDLAAAELGEVIKLWEGLGYYSRARHLLKAARYLVESHQGELPSTYHELEKVIGLGDYTIGAILSFAFHQKAAAVDGNVIRVLSRYLALEEVVCLPSTKSKIKQYAEEILPDEEPWVVAEGLIELGAMVCTRTPKCFLCPLSGSCEGLKRGIADLLPIKKEKPRATVLEREVAVIVGEGAVLLQKGSKGRVMADLYEFPYVDAAQSSKWYQEWISRGLALQFQEKLPPITHTFTRFRATLYPTVWKALARIEIPGYDWFCMQEVVHLPFSAGHRRVLSCALKRADI